MKWKALLNLALSALAWGVAGFVASITAVEGMPTKGALGVAGVAAFGSIIQHLRQSPDLWKPLLIVPLLVLMGGCATGGVDVQLPKHPEPQSLGEVLANLKSDTLLDLDAAQTIALAHNDVIAAACYPVLKKYLAPATGQTTVDKVIGLVSGFEKLRSERMALEAAGGIPGIPADLRLGCAALLQTEKEFALRIAALLAGGTVPGVGVVAPFLPK